MLNVEIDAIANQIKISANEESLTLGIDQAKLLAKVLPGAIEALDEFEDDLFEVWD